MPAPIPIRGAQADIAAPRPDPAALGDDLSAQHHGGRSRAHSFAFSGQHTRAPDQPAGPPPSSSFLGYLSALGSPRREMSSWTTPSSEASGPPTPPSLDHDHGHHDEHKDTFGCMSTHCYVHAEPLRRDFVPWPLDAALWSAFELECADLREATADMAAPAPAETAIAPSTSPSTGISGWLAQQRAAPQAEASTASPIGLFRRLSIGSPPASFKLGDVTLTQQPPFAPATSAPAPPTTTEQTDMPDLERGRFFRRSLSTSKRKLSPMSERMLRASEGHF